MSELWVHFAAVTVRLDDKTPSCCQEQQLSFVRWLRRCLIMIRCRAPQRFLSAVLCPVDAFSCTVYAIPVRATAGAEASEQNLLTTSKQLSEAFHKAS